MTTYELDMRFRRDDAIDEAKLNGHKYLVMKLFDECCTSAVRKSRFESCPDMPTARVAAMNMTADVDWSATEWHEDGDENVEFGDPAWDRAMRELEDSHSIRLDDYRIVIGEIV